MYHVFSVPINFEAHTALIRALDRYTWRQLSPPVKGGPLHVYQETLMVPHSSEASGTETLIAICSGLFVQGFCFKNFLETQR